MHTWQKRAGQLLSTLFCLDKQRFEPCPGHCWFERAMGWSSQQQQQQQQQA
jgi:hypothetical protein